MTSQDLIIASRLTHLHDLRNEIARLHAENTHLREENASLKAHFDLALLAAEDLRACSALEIWDGWNLLLGAKKEAPDRAALLVQAEARAVDGTRVWVVFDGPDENVQTSGSVRVSYTGGSGQQRADKFICDYLRMAKYLGLADRITVRTNDKDLARTVRRLKGESTKSANAVGRFR